MEDIEAMTKPWLESYFTPTIELFGLPVTKIYCTEYLIFEQGKTEHALANMQI